MKNSNLPYVVRIGIASCIGNDKAVEQAIEDLYYNINCVFNYASIDDRIHYTLARYGIAIEDYAL